MCCYSKLGLDVLLMSRAQASARIQTRCRSSDSIHINKKATFGFGKHSWSFATYLRNGRNDFIAAVMNKIGSFNTNCWLIHYRWRIMGLVGIDDIANAKLMNHLFFIMPCSVSHSWQHMPAAIFNFKVLLNIIRMSGDMVLLWRPRRGNTLKLTNFTVSGVQTGNMSCCPGGGKLGKD